MINLSKELKQIADNYLLSYQDLQFIKLAEECSELSQSSLKIYNTKMNELAGFSEYTNIFKSKMEYNLAEEIGDVLFMIYQIMKHRNISQEQIEIFLRRKHM